MEKNLCVPVSKHHEIIEEKGFTVLFTSLIGSQNYGLDDEQSDVDTVSVVLPSFEDLSFGKKPCAGEIVVEDGKCMYKDFRHELNLLERTSPNSAEVFCSKYITYNEDYWNILSEYMMRHDVLKYMVHANYDSMIDACAGLSRQLTKRNMSAGKRYSHSLRMMELLSKYTSNLDINDLFMLSRGYRETGLWAKRQTTEQYFNERCEIIANHIDNFKSTFVKTEEMTHNEKMGKQYIEEFRNAVMKALFRSFK